MRLCRLFILAVAVTLAAPAVVHAQGRDPLEALAGNQALTRDEIATIEVQVATRVAKLLSAQTESQRQLAKRSLLTPAKFKNATKAFLEAYIDACAKELRRVVVGPFDPALDAVMILREFDHPASAVGLVGSLASQHRAVRYAAAEAIARLHRRIRSKAVEQVLLDALGKAGAAEADGLVLRAIYRAIDFKSDQPDFAQGDLCAAALAETLAGRVQLVQGGSRNEYADLPGLALVGAYYGNAKADVQAELARAVYELESHAAERFLQSQGSQIVLANVSKAAESALHEILKKGGVTPPQKINLDAKSDPASVRKGLDAQMVLLKGPPWNLKF